MGQVSVTTPDSFFNDADPMLNEALRLIRVFHDQTQTDLARELGVSKSYLSEIESGKKVVTIELLKKYSDKFGVPISSLMLFSENLDSNTFGSRARMFAAGKVVSIMRWLAEKENHEGNGSEK